MLGRPISGEPAFVTEMLFTLTVAASIASLKRMMRSGLTGPKIAVRTSAMLVEGKFGGGAGGAMPAPTPLCPFTG